MRALTLLCIPILLAACATEQVVRDECHVNAAPLEPRACPVWRGTTYRDLGEYCAELQAACSASEADKTDVRDQLRGKDDGEP